MTSMLRATWFAAVWFAVGSPGVAQAAGLQPGEYACAGSGGRILIGLGFKLNANGTYTDLDGKNPGRVNTSSDGSSVTFVGGHLDGEVGTKVSSDGKNFQFKIISCSKN
jgi:hypothetical protein